MKRREFLIPPGESAKVRFAEHSFIRTLSVSVAMLHSGEKLNSGGASATCRPDPAANMRVLVVEDHEDTRFLLKTLLEMRGIKVLEAEDGRAGIDAAERERPDMIFMDGSLPQLDGLAATRRIREIEDLRQVPIVYLSGHVAPDFQTTALDAGCTEYLTKPIDFDQFNSVLKKHLRNLQKAQ